VPEEPAAIGYFALQDFQTLVVHGAKERRLRSKVLEDQHPLGMTRAVMIEGPSHEAIEIVEVDPRELPAKPRGLIDGAVP